ncbi:inositol phospholipid synthesis and fat-storage-inducing TM-domain-containing protein [Amylostereum chailletii]|nr:inositol phospholipid synthesis and fat-storage-inducing TM-domain-containing protein [Amylostereum chailletii]
MADLRLLILALTFFTVLHGTQYSIRHETYLDTSNPLLTSAHPLTATHYFASKHNPLNIIFLKRAWGWTTLAFLPVLLTAPNRRIRRVFQYILATASWAAFTTWFFGPALIERVIFLTGGECVLHVPGGDESQYLPVPEEYCFGHERISYDTHPHLFSSIVPASLDIMPTMPRMRRGHDISGHIFLLTLSCLFLGDQIRQSLARRTWSAAHGWALGGAGAVLALWLFSLWVTSVYFHTPAEKVSGFVLGVATFGITQVPVWLSHLQTTRVERSKAKTS